MITGVRVAQSDIWGSFFAFGLQSGLPGRAAGDAIGRVMGCFHSKQVKFPQGYEDPIVLANDTSCE